MSLIDEGMDSYEEDNEGEIATVNFHEKMYYESDIKKSIKAIKEILYKICDKRGVVTKSDIKWKFIEEFGEGLTPFHGKVSK